MRQSILHRLFECIAKELSGVIQLLGPSISNCLFCNKTIKTASIAPGSPPVILSQSFKNAVCQTCINNIPWLNVIQCQVCGRGIPCRDCARRTDSEFIANRSAVQYSGTMREWLAQYKYRGNEHLEPFLAEMMIPIVLTLTREIQLRTKESFQWDAITFVPVSPEREEERGFNQAERLAAILARHFHIPLVDLLVRERHTEKQSFKSRSERMQDTRSLFKVKPDSMTEFYNSNQHHLFHKKRILLIDDIYTTGSTIQACAVALNLKARFPLDIYSITWARS